MFKNILSALAVTAIGFVFLNLAFMLDYAFQSLILFILRPLAPVDTMLRTSSLPVILHFSFMLVIAIASWGIFRSRIHENIKAAYLTVPLAVVYVTIGMFTYRYPAAPFFFGTACAAASLAFILRKKVHWIYLFAWGLISLLMLLGAIFRVEI